MTTTNTPSTVADTDAPRPMPLWASIPIILVCLTAGGWILHWYVGSHLQADEPHLLGDVPTAPAGGGRGWAGQFGNGRRYVRQLRQDANRELYEARTEQADARWTIPNRRPPILNFLSYGNSDTAYSFVPADVLRTIRAAAQLIADPRAVSAVKLTPEQARRLQPLCGRFGMTASAADRAALTADFAAYRAAALKDRNAAQTKLLAEMDAVAARSIGSTRQTAADHATKINAIVTPEQWTQFQAMGGRP